GRADGGPRAEGHPETVRADRRQHHAGRAHARPAVLVTADPGVRGLPLAGGGAVPVRLGHPSGRRRDGRSGEERGERDPARSPAGTARRARSVETPLMLAELASAVRERRVSATELVRSALERIERHNGALNAVVALRPDEALDEARVLDERVARGEDPGPLAGLPFLVKDMEDVAGMRTTFGSLLFADAPAAAADGLVPRRLRAAGAIPLGKTNLPEFAFAGFTDNRLFGPTRNPWNADWSPGGSSGGSAAALAAGMVPIATATDGGGSIRIPSALCGLVGLKPTNGVIGRDPIPDWIDLSTFGPIASTVADVRLLLEVEAGPVPGDPTALPHPLETRPDLPRRAFAAQRFVDYGPLPEGVRASFQSALARVELDLGLPVEPLGGGVLRSGDSGADWLTMCAAEHVHHLGAGLVRANLERFSEPFRARMERG